MNIHRFYYCVYQISDILIFKTKFKFMMPILSAMLVFPDEFFLSSSRRRLLVVMVAVTANGSASNPPLMTQTPSERPETRSLKIKAQISLHLRPVPSSKISREALKIDLQGAMHIGCRRKLQLNCYRCHQSVAVRIS